MKFEPLAAPSESSETRAPADPAVRFTLDHPLFAGQSFAVNFRVCPNPCCPCGVVGFECRPESAPGRSFRFDLDVIQRRLNRKAQRAPEGVAIGRAFLAEAQETDWIWLGDFFMRTKRRLMETMELDELDVQFPPDVLAGEGTMVCYREVFPWAERIDFSHDGSAWFVDDQYCVRPGCDCTESGLGFFRVPDSNARLSKPIESSTFLFLDCCTGKSNVTETRPDSPAPDELFKALRSTHPDLAQILRHRHKQLKQLGRRLIPKALHEVPQDLSSDGSWELDAPTMDWLQQPPAPEIERALKPKRPGRNDPCPCGSGKKYKKCCGAG